jgi:hypothetical protein
MAGQQRRLRPVLGLVAGLLIALGWAAAPPPADAAFPTWNGGINLYRTGVFATQRTWLWCTAADVQIMRNIKYGQQDHSRSNQSKYFSYMRGHNRYSLPVSAGVDPKGWEMGLRRYVDPRYRVQSHDTFAKALKLAAARMRRTNLPVAVAVSRGNHGWVLHGFTATADPLKTSTFTVTSVRVSGPLWGLQSRSYGYDMRPNTKLTVSQFKSFFTKWWYAPKRMIWDNRFVSIQPMPTSSSTASAGTTGAATTDSTAMTDEATIGAAAAQEPAPAAQEPVPAAQEPAPAASEVAPSFAAGGPAPSTVTRPTPATDPRPVIPIGLVLAGLGLAVVIIVATLGRASGRGTARGTAGGTPARSTRRVRGPRAGWSS